MITASGAEGISFKMYVMYITEPIGILLEENKLLTR